MSSTQSKFYLPCQFESLTELQSKAGKPYYTIQVSSLEDNGIHDFGVWGESLKVVRKLKPKDVIEVVGNIKSNPYNGRNYTKLNVLEVRMISNMTVKDEQSVLAPVDAGDFDDIPF